MNKLLQETLAPKIPELELNLTTLELDVLKLQLADQDHDVSEFSNALNAVTALDLALDDIEADVTGEALIDNLDTFNAEVDDELQMTVEALKGDKVAKRKSVLEFFKAFGKSVDVWLGKTMKRIIEMEDVTINVNKYAVRIKSYKAKKAELKLTKRGTDFLSIDGSSDIKKNIDYLNGLLDKYSFSSKGIAYKQLIEILASLKTIKGGDVDLGKLGLDIDGLKETIVKDYKYTAKSVPKISGDTYIGPVLPTNVRSVIQFSNKGVAIKKTKGGKVNVAKTIKALDGDALADVSLALLQLVNRLLEIKTDTARIVDTIDDIEKVINDELKGDNLTAKEAKELQTAVRNAMRITHEPSHLLISTTVSWTIWAVGITRAMASNIDHPKFLNEKRV